MAKELSEEERTSLSDLEENFQDHVDRYRKQKESELDAAGKMKLLEELNGLQSYLEGCRRSEIDDLLITIEFKSAQAGVLKRILGMEE